MGIRIKKIKGKVIDIGDEVANEIVVRDAGISYAIPFGNIKNMPKENAEDWLKGLRMCMVVFNADKGILEKDSL
jgi:predicted RecA/RadA family phage recombinase